MIRKVRKLPVEIEAMEFTGYNSAEVAEWLGELGTVVPSGAGPLDVTIAIENPQGPQTPAVVGDWIMRGVKGEFYPVPGDVFKMTYEFVD